MTNAEREATEFIEGPGCKLCSPEGTCLHCLAGVIEQAEKRGRTEKAAEIIYDKTELALSEYRKGLLRGAEKLEKEAKFQRQQFCLLEAIILETQAEAIQKEAKK